MRGFIGSIKFGAAAMAAAVMPLVGTGGGADTSRPMIALARGYQHIP